MNRFLEEIRQIPEALASLAHHYRKEGREPLSAFVKEIRKRRGILFSGMGTSEFAPLLVRHRLARGGIACRMIDAGEWFHFDACPAGMTVLISQSGESVEVKRLLEEGRVPPPFFSITNNLDSTLGRMASISLPLCAGEESAISTKTYVNTLALLHLLASALEKEARTDRALDELDRVAETILRVDGSEIREAAAFLSPADALAFVGRGPAYVAARQCALTFMEGARCLAAGFTGGAFRHGPFEAAGPDLRLVLFLPEGKTRASTEAMGREAAGLGARVVFLADSPPDANRNTRKISVEPAPDGSREDLFPVAVSAAHFLFLHHVAKTRGIEAGTFRYGSKVTSRE